jgi:hypothetical protein
LLFLLPADEINSDGSWNLGRSSLENLSTLGSFPVLESVVSDQGSTSSSFAVSTSSSASSASSSSSLDASSSAPPRSDYRPLWEKDLGLFHSSFGPSFIVLIFLLILFSLFFFQRRWLNRKLRA